jgi:hypothetical protein
MALDGDSGWQSVDAGGGAAPFVWVTDTYLLVGTNPSRLIPVTEDGRVGAPIQFADPYFPSPLYWTSATTFYYLTQGDDGRAFVTLGTVEGERVRIDPIDVVPGNMIRWFVDPCFLGVGQSEVVFGAFVPEYRTTGRRSGEGVEQGILARDGSGAVWSDGERTVWQALDDECTPVGDPRLLAETSSRRLAFLPNGSR